MTDQLLQAIEERLAERRLAQFKTLPDKYREKALISLVQRARNNDEDGKERLEKLLKLFKPFPQFSEWVAEQMASKYDAGVVYGEAEAPQPITANPINESPSPHWSIRELTRRQMREAGHAPSLATPDPPNPEWYANGPRPSLTVADKLKRLFGPKPEPGDGGWMRNR